MPHTSCRRGKRVYVVLKDGTKFVDKFLDHHGPHVEFAERRVRAGDIRVFSMRPSRKQPLGA